MNLQDPILVLGAGESGVGSALLAKALGARAFVSDAGQGKGPGVDELKAAGIDHEVGGHRPETWPDAQVVVKSPGIPDTADVVVACQTRGCEVISDIDGSNASSGPDGFCHTTKMPRPWLISLGCACSTPPVLVSNGKIASRHAPSISCTST